MGEDVILKRIADAIDELDADGLAKLHNELTNNEPVTGDDIILEPGYHLSVTY
jgi:hypothetical protein